MNGAPPQPEQDPRPLRRWTEQGRRAGLPESTCLPGLRAGPGITGETGESPPGPPPGPLDMPPPGRTPRSPSPGNAFFPVIRPSAALRRRKKPYIYKEMKNFFHETISTFGKSFIHNSLFLRKEPFICKDLRLSLSLSPRAYASLHTRG